MRGLVMAYGLLIVAVILTAIIVNGLYTDKDGVQTELKKFEYTESNQVGGNVEEVLSDESVTLTFNTKDQLILLNSGVGTTSYKRVSREQVLLGESFYDTTFQTNFYSMLGLTYGVSPYSEFCTRASQIWQPVVENGILKLDANGNIVYVENRIITSNGKYKPEFLTAVSNISDYKGISVVVSSGSTDKYNYNIIQIFPYDNNYTEESYQYARLKSCNIDIMKIDTDNLPIIPSTTSLKDISKTTNSLQVGYIKGTPNNKLGYNVLGYYREPNTLYSFDGLEDNSYRPFIKSSFTGRYNVLIKATTEDGRQYEKNIIYIIDTVI